MRPRSRVVEPLKLGYCAETETLSEPTTTVQSQERFVKTHLNPTSEYSFVQPVLRFFSMKKTHQTLIFRAKVCLNIITVFNGLNETLAHLIRLNRFLS